MSCWSESELEVKYSDGNGCFSWNEGVCSFDSNQATALGCTFAPNSGQMMYDAQGCQDIYAYQANEDDVDVYEENQNDVACMDSEHDLDAYDDNGQHGDVSSSPFMTDAFLSHSSQAETPRTLTEKRSRPGKNGAARGSRSSEASVDACGDMGAYSSRRRGAAKIAKRKVASPKISPRAMDHASRSCEQSRRSTAMAVEQKDVWKRRCDGEKIRWLTRPRKDSTLDMGMDRSREGQSHKNYMLAKFFVEHKMWFNELEFADEGLPCAYAGIKKIMVMPAWKFEFFSGLTGPDMLNLKVDWDAFMAGDALLGLDMEARAEHKSEQHAKGHGKKQNARGFQGRDFKNLQNTLG